MREERKWKKNMDSEKNNFSFVFNGKSVIHASDFLDPPCEFSRRIPLYINLSRTCPCISIGCHEKYIQKFGRRT
jgi:hypothetical protein